MTAPGLEYGSPEYVAGIEAHQQLCRAVEALGKAFDLAREAGTGDLDIALVDLMRRGCSAQQVIMRHIWPPAI